MRKSKFLDTLLVIYVVLSAAACGGDGGAGTANPDQPDLSASVSAPNQTVPQTTPPPVTPTPETILKSITATSSSLTSYEGKLTTVMNMSLAGMVMDFDITASMAVDIASKKVFVDMNTAGVTTQMYIINDTEYIKVNVPDGQLQANVWYKVVLPSSDFQDMWLSQDLGKQYQILLNQASLTIVGTEEVGGKTCFKVKITPDLVNFMAYLDASGSNLADMGIADPAHAFKQLEVTFWVDTTTYVTVKTDMVIEIDVQGMKMKMTMIMVLDRVNQPIVIALPFEAQSAVILDY
ncbi:hypothetical protein [Dehalogenimonas alkenigignens]|uniref:Lipoprotein n=1 Tax=Dehalogenimonas alkenigignens TaxID=1217799 RepID=A0A0W0GH41_9CHLR|nr:hypothetical protein [Dehalogenimonas alkenigignens]KTB47868.1 hypothetical protein DEALK_07130 [Dehalogenimonas alkenigignens]